MKNSSSKERDRVCDEYEKWFWTTDLVNDLSELKGKILGCYCKPLRCHGDFLAKIVNSEYEIQNIKKRMVIKLWQTYGISLIKQLM